MTMSKPINIRLDEIHLELLEMTIKKLEEREIKTNRTDLIQKAIYAFSREYLDEEEITKVIDKHYKGFN